MRFCEAPADEWAPAFLAVAGYFTAFARDQSRKRIRQLARIWYRRGRS